MRGNLRCKRAHTEPDKTYVKSGRGGGVRVTNIKKKKKKKMNTGLGWYSDGPKPSGCKMVQYLNAVRIFEYKTSKICPGIQIASEYRTGIRTFSDISDKTLRWSDGNCILIQGTKNYGIWMSKTFFLNKSHPFLQEVVGLNPAPGFQ